jgi:hypothetical protein
MTPREHFDLTHDAAQAHLASIPEDRLEPKPPVLFRCPECGTEQDVAVCPKCNDLLCSSCDPDPVLHVACMPPEMIEDRVRANRGLPLVVHADSEGGTKNVGVGYLLAS